MDTASYVQGKLDREFEIVELMRTGVSDAEYDKFIRLITRPVAGAGSINSR